MVVIRNRGIWLLLVTLLTLTTPLAEQTGSDSRVDRIMAEGNLSVCIWPDYYGISWRNPKTGELIGIDVDHALELGADIDKPGVIVVVAKGTLHEPIVVD